MRDYQRARIYRAEEYLDRNRFVKFSSIEECREYANVVWSAPTLRARFPKALKRKAPPIKVARSKVSNLAYLPPNERVTLCELGWCDYWVLHELAHIITEREFAVKGNRLRHGPLWVDTHL